MFTNLKHAEENIWTIREEVTGGWRKFHNDLYSSSNIKVIKLRTVRWVRHVARMWDGVKQIHGTAEKTWNILEKGG